MKFVPQFLFSIYSWTFVFLFCIPKYVWVSCCQTLAFSTILHIRVVWYRYEMTCWRLNSISTSYFPLIGFTSLWGEAGPIAACEGWLARQLFGSHVLFSSRHVTRRKTDEATQLCWQSGTVLVSKDVSVLLGELCSRTNLSINATHTCMLFSSLFACS